jgi:GTP-binding protein
LLLIDARQGFKASDLQVMSMLDRAAVSYQVVLTKCDKVKPGALGGLLRSMADDLKRHPAAHPEILTTSAQTKSGIAELRAVLAEFTARSDTTAG